MAVSSMETGHICRIGDIDWSGDTAPSLDDRTCGARQVEPWLSAILQAEHLSLLLGNGVTTAAVSLAGGSPVSIRACAGLFCRLSRPSTPRASR